MNLCKSFEFKNKANKKVLLREHKRFTARRVPSTRCAALSNPDLVRGGGTLSPGWGVRIPGPGEGVPIPGLGGYLSQVWGDTPSQVQGGTPSQDPRDGVPPWTWDGVPPRPGTGYPPGPGTWYPPRPGTGTPLDLGWVPPYLDLRWGTPLPRPEMGYPPRNGGQSENITFRHPLDAGGKY